MRPPSLHLARKLVLTPSRQARQALEKVLELERNNSAPRPERLDSEDIVSTAQRFQSSAFPQPSNVSYPEFVGRQLASASATAYGDPMQSTYQRNGSMYAESARRGVAPKRKRGTGGDIPNADGTAQSPAKKQRVRHKKNNVPPSSVDPDLTAIQFEGSEYPALPGEGLEADFEAVAKRAREISAASRKPKEPQSRTAWVQSDVRALIKAVDIFKCKWSLIERQIKDGKIPFQIPRDQQALRDKARLLKQDLLK